MNAVRPLKLLIVDDSNIIRRRIERSQQIERLRVVGSAANGREAIDLFAQTDPDVVTMDLTMPEMDGIECVEHLVAKKPQILILVVSALADKATASKPFARARMVSSASRSPTASSTMRSRSCCRTSDVLTEAEIKTFIDGAIHYFAVSARQPVAVGSPYLITDGARPSTNTRASSLSPARARARSASPRRDRC